MSKTNNEVRQPMGDRMPVLFVGHGSPMNAIEDNRWSRGFRQLGALAGRPRAIVAISAHWYVRGTYLTGNAEPKTIHDFSGFPQALYEVNYPARGHVDLAKRVCTLVGEERAALDSGWGFDHGTWSILRWMFPEADVPVIQLSIDRRLDVSEHHEIGRALAGLRDDGVLIVASGNIVHNLGDAIGRMQRRNLDTPPWARAFDDTVTKAATQHDTSALLSVWPETDAGRMSHPTPDHWFPLIYAHGATDDRDDVRFANEGFDWGSLSMRSIIWG